MCISSASPSPPCFPLWTYTTVTFCIYIFGGAGLLAVKEEVHQHPLLWSDRHCCAFLLTCRLPRASTMTHVTAMMCQTIHHWQLWCKLFINIYAKGCAERTCSPPARPPASDTTPPTRMRAVCYSVNCEIARGECGMVLISQSVNFLSPPLLAHSTA